MAYIEGYPGEKIETTTGKHLGFIVIVVVLLVGFLAYSADDWREEIPSIILTVSIVVAVILFVSYKINPLGWRRIFRKERVEEALRMDRLIADRLAELDDSHFIFHDITFELFHVENLVICPGGIFVIEKLESPDALAVRGKILFAGDEPLDTVTGNLWRVCHLINIVMEKGFKEDIMPQPLLVRPGEASVNIGDFDGIIITTLDGMIKAIEGRHKKAIEQELVERFAFYMKKRYT